MTGKEWPKVAGVPLHLPNKNRIILSLGYLLFFLMLFTPLTYKLLKFILLLIIISSTIIKVLYHGKIHLHRDVLLWTLFVVSIGLAFMLRGLFNGAPGALRVGTVYVLWPMLFTLLISYASSEHVLRNLMKLLVISTLVIGLYNMSYVLYSVGWLPDILYIPIDQGQAIGYHEGYLEYHIYNINSLFFLVPFLVMALLTWTKEITPIRRLWILFALILGLIVSLLSARRALILIIFVAPVLSLLFRTLLPYDIKQASRSIFIRYFAITTILIGVFIIYLILFNISSIFVVLESIFSEDDVSNSIRKEQLFALLTGFEESPLLGAGLGASAPGYIRSEEMPWAYELYYLALLFQTGMLGFLAYSVAIAWIFWNAIAMIRSGNIVGLWMSPVLLGMCCFLIGSATNPYICTFDYMWVLFLPIAFINFWLLRVKKGYVKPPATLEDLRNFNDTIT